MKTKANLRRFGGLCTAIVLSMSAGHIWAAKGGEHPGTPEEEMRYKGAPVPIKPEEAQERISPKAPPRKPRGQEPRQPGSSAFSCSWNAPSGSDSPRCEPIGPDDGTLVLRRFGILRERPLLRQDRPLLRIRSILNLLLLQ